MKKIAFLLMHTVAVSLTLLTVVDAQNHILRFHSPANSKSVSSPFTKFGFGEKKANAFNLKAIRDFVKTYNEINNNEWFFAENGTSTSTFTNDEIETQVAYDSKGNRMYILRIYKENKLAKDIRDRVKREYYDAIITLVKELHTYDGLFIYVHLQDKDNLKVIRITNGIMELVETINKNE